MPVIMQLADYLKTNGISDEDFGQSIGVTRQAVHRYKTFDRFPEKPVLTEIVKATAGAVTPNDFLPEQSNDQAPREKGAA
jgi:transcriptional regulator with XRE-family HTH domain